MPTRGRQEWAAQAVECFLSQDYPSKRLIIVDDAEDPSFPGGFPSDIRYRSIYYTARPVTIRNNIPEKLNMCAEIAVGSDILMRFDSDDWSAPTRMSEQVKRLEQTGQQVTGYRSMLFHEPSTGLAWRYQANPKLIYALGSSLAFTYAHWKQHRWPENKPIGSDNYYVRLAKELGQMDCCEGGQMMVARIHGGNTSPKHNRGPQYVSVDWDQLPAEYRALEPVMA